MKKFTFMLMALLTMTIATQAKTVETVLWEDTYTGEIELNAETVATLAAGETLRIYATVPNDGGNFKIVYKGEGNGWQETTIPSIGNQWPWINGGETYKDFTLTDADITALTAMGIYIYNGSCSVTKVTKVVENANIVEVTIGESGWATWSYDKNLNFDGTGINVYYATAVSQGTVTLTAVTTTWNWCGYILKGEAGTYDVPVVDDASATYPNGNYLKAQVGAGTVAASTAGAYHYILADNDGTVGFYNLATDYSMAANKAYLETEANITPAAGGRINIVVDDNPTGINVINKTQVGNQQIYNLNGQRVAHPQKGLYISNGKKFINK